MPTLKLVEYSRSVAFVRSKISIFLKKILTSKQDFRDYMYIVDTGVIAILGQKES